MNANLTQISEYLRNKDLLEMTKDALFIINSVIEHKEKGTNRKVYDLCNSWKDKLHRVTMDTL